MAQDNKDLCKTCEHYWVDFPLPLDHVEGQCEIIDGRLLHGAMSVCPFNSYKKKKVKLWQ